MSDSEGQPEQGEQGLERKQFWISCLSSTVVHVAFFLVLILIDFPEERARTPLEITSRQISEDKVVEVEHVEIPALIDVDTNDADVLDVNESMDVIHPQVVAVSAIVENVRQSALEVVDAVEVDFVRAMDPTGFNGPLAGRGRSGGSGGFGGEIGRRLMKAGAKSGAVQISLLWNNYNDLDLHVIAPSGERIFFGNSRSGCGGHLDVDMNAAISSNKPVENIYWPKVGAPRGRYQVIVNFYSQKDSMSDTPFEVYIKVDGVMRSHKGMVSNQSRNAAIAEFDRTKHGSPLLIAGDFPE